MKTTVETPRMDVQSNDNSKTFTVSIKGMDRLTWNKYKVEAIKQGMTLAELFVSISERLDELFE